MKAGLDLYSFYSFGHGEGIPYASSMHIKHS
jgi:hypothetical protein